MSALILLLSIALYGLLHSWLASNQAKALARRAFGPAADRVYRFLYNVFSVISLLPILALVMLLPDRLLYTIPSPWVFLTTLLQILALLALLVGVLQTGLWSFVGLEQLFSPAIDAPAQLVQHGLYRWVRHPLYTAGLVLIWLTPVMTLNLFIFYLGLSVYLVIGAYFEERKLSREYGPAYAAYKARTPMFIPGLPRRR
jgi:protein-S-isoprenylcysteine O-methyltransferase Ste14